MIWYKNVTIPFGYVSLISILIKGNSSKLSVHFCQLSSVNRQLPSSLLNKLFKIERRCLAVNPYLCTRIMSYTRSGTLNDLICYAQSANELVFFTPVFSQKIYQFIINQQA